MQLAKWTTAMKYKLASLGSPSRKKTTIRHGERGPNSVCVLVCVLPLCVCFRPDSADGFLSPSRSNSRNGEKDWENASTTSSVTSFTEYTGTLAPPLCQSFCPGTDPSRPENGLEVLIYVWVSLAFI